MVTITHTSRVPNSPQLNQDFYLVFSFGATATFTGAFASLGSVVSPIRASGASFVAIYPAGSIPVGSYAIYGFVVSGSTGSFTNSASITIQDSAIADPAKTLYDILRNNVGASYASTLFTTGWYSESVSRPTVTVTRDRREDKTINLSDTARSHDERVHVDTWVGERYFGVGVKNAHTLLDDEVKRIINANRKAPSAKIRHMQITDSLYLPEVADNRRIFRTRHTVRLKWDETIS